ncbi:GTP-binding protein [Fusobacterium animalis]|uniref:GTP-binding protein n=1 Tax=Fusobacterium animalis TaxID=76859 RepID=A0A2G9FFD6_9FUSO|nr:GTP-binding protein [Fusobacterium animalis]PIM91847.1 GTP-binding protein [Fusobacterium animalis]PIM93289.1 GTP-binding protein [Fusobacterium animalis]BEO89801.1 GTP-binding protein [Fusobacterium nucleatum]BEP01687.1 GTP-binding protein [Fusobacterium nucleatum]
MKILLVSGFLGAGKTTFIKELAKNINLEFVVLENEYADIGVDKDFLDEKNLNVWEMSEGCICCSMKGDFKSSIKRIYSEINPEYLVVEPTGVGMLSSIIENIRDINNNDIEILSPITLIDITSFSEYLETFNSFFTDNLKNTGKVILTKLENSNHFEIENIKNEILKINNNLEIITDDYRNFPKEWFADLLNKSIDNKIIDKNFSLKTHINLRTFSKENVNLKTMDELGLLLNRLVNGDFGKIYRAKGIVKIDGYWGKFNLVYKNFEMEPITDAKGTKIVIIGNNLDIENLKNI